MLLVLPPAARGELRFLAYALRLYAPHDLMPSHLDITSSPRQAVRAVSMRIGTFIAIQSINFFLDTYHSQTFFTAKFLSSHVFARGRARVVFLSPFVPFSRCHVFHARCLLVLGGFRTTQVKVYLLF